MSEQPEDAGKPWWASRTIRVNVASILGVIAAQVGLDLPPETLAVIILNVVNIALRFDTKGPVSK